MGSVARSPDEFAGPDEERPDEESGYDESLGDALSGLFADADVDSVEAVRGIREDG